VRWPSWKAYAAQIGDRIVLTLDLNERTAAVTWDKTPEVAYYS
jgi:hypothetical protein